MAGSLKVGFLPVTEKKGHRATSSKDIYRELIIMKHSTTQMYKEGNEVGKGVTYAVVNKRLVALDLMPQGLERVS